MSIEVQSHKGKSSTVADRRAQIIQATLRLVAEDGIQGATMIRIANIVGVSTAALYRYFDSREAILLAAFDTLIDRVLDWLRSSDRVDAVSRLWDVLSQHADLFSKDVEGFNAPIFQFRLHLPNDHIREHVSRRTEDMMKAYEDVIDDGKAQGSIRADVESRSVVSDLLAWIYWEDLSYLTGLGNGFTRKKSADMLGRILREIAANGSWADGQLEAPPIL